MSKTIKICGIKNVDDALFCVSKGANALGFVAYPKSIRFIEAEMASQIISTCQQNSPSIDYVAVLVSPEISEIRKYVQAGVNVLQIHSTTGVLFDHTKVLDLFPNVKIWTAVGDKCKNISLTDLASDALVFDSFDPLKIGGTGIVPDWTKALELKKSIKTRFILAGGLSPNNVSSAIKMLSPDGVDVSSGVEKSPGIKDKNKISDFIDTAIRAWKMI
jgi:phosphoribosylanthranilate isomerase